MDISLELKEILNEYNKGIKSNLNLEDVIKEHKRAEEMRGNYNNPTAGIVLFHNLTYIPLLVEELEYANLYISKIEELLREKCE